MILLTSKLWFPDVSLAGDDGLLAAGGDLDADRLLLAYRSGIFPWFMEGGIVYWFSPPERMVLFPGDIHISKSMKQVLRSNRFRVTKNNAFEQVITGCSVVQSLRHSQTWISETFITSYIRLYELGHAHSIEVWENDTLVGGLYGVGIGKMFCGESMFSILPNTSKIALITLCGDSRWSLIDCQVQTAHLASMGAKIIGREEYLVRLKQFITS